jgi:hypothetical protein
MVKRPTAPDWMPIVLVKMPPASESDPRSARIRQTLKENLEFAFPGYKFQFVPEAFADRQFTVMPSNDSDGGKSTDLDELRQIQSAVKRIATAMVLGTVQGSRSPGR